jgi:hypothetical protein
MFHFDKNNLPPTVGELIARDILEERRSFALALIPKDFNDVEIAELTKLSVEEIAELRETL